LCHGGEAPAENKRSSVQSNVTISDMMAKTMKKGWRKVLQRGKTTAALMAHKMNKHTDLDDRIGIDELTEGTRGIEAKRVHGGSVVAKEEKPSQSQADALSAWGPM